jgi:thymidylate synthase (FAD)
MKVIKSSFEILSEIDRSKVLSLIELAGRTCYKSEDKITEESSSKFIKNVIASGHEAVIEHFNITVKFICDRGVTHELVRHRLASYCQESTRYCNYSKDKFGNELTFIEPLFWKENDIPYQHWYKIMQECERVYLEMIKIGVKPQEARSILPNSLKTEIIVTANLREWRHILRLRTSTKAHPQIREIMKPLLYKLNEILPEVFSDIVLSEEKI